MKKKMAGVGLSMALCALSASAQTQPQKKPGGAPPAMTAEQQAMMDAMQKAATPGANHKVLQSLVGDWTFAMKMWEDPAGPAHESSGTTSTRSLMDGRYVQSEHKGNFMGMPFHGMGVTGYDNVSKQFQSSWLDNMSTGQMLMNGSYDAPKKTLTFRGDMDDMMKPGTKTKIRETVRIVNTDTHVMEWYETRAGATKEAKTMEITYKRTKK
jgi:hypothetical protein